MGDRGAGGAEGCTDEDVVEASGAGNLAVEATAESSGAEDPDEDAACDCDPGWGEPAEERRVACSVPRAGDAGESPSGSEKDPPRDQLEQGNVPPCASCLFRHFLLNFFSIFFTVRAVFSSVFD